MHKTDRYLRQTNDRTDRGEAGKLRIISGGVWSGGGAEKVEVEERWKSGGKEGRRSKESGIHCDPYVRSSSVDITNRTGDFGCTPTQISDIVLYYLLDNSQCIKVVHIAAGPRPRCIEWFAICRLWCTTWKIRHTGKALISECGGLCICSS